ncbi:rRNA (guanine-N(1)-)-methyltransferase [Paucilactobacillus oligofermentans DSM 15707 = LMG 22743]|uniref:rRNA (Guanine-N(1)-)-methyltransferase n=1 Tax=Paucilactobacillus oligofermentans DSM 15707 = LMG 22743 TaxID=1423778 RepID=A0A0R1RCU8_9LACO|nr:rRNA (guanine-N(1)-)-methyltransferase [Paucilactobacillus oligofermentans DSM 15707 = LMG 22743]
MPAATVEGNSLVCQNGHQLDFNKQGYLYFLFKAVNGEYDREMLSSRRKLLNKGLFAPIVDEIVEELDAKAQTILDVGCGEGTPLKYLEDLRMRKDTAIGFDISKDGIGLATQLDTNAWFCAADLRQLPFNDQTFDTILEIFSPSDYAEFKRVLKPGGTLIKVIPNPEYLIELRQLLYPTGNHQTYDNSAVVELFKNKFADSVEKQVRYKFALPNDLKTQMVEMTPLHWGKDAKKLTETELINLKEITVDVTLLIAKNNLS